MRFFETIFHDICIGKIVVLRTFSECVEAANYDTDGINRQDLYVLSELLLSIGFGFPVQFPVPVQAKY